MKNRIKNKQLLYIFVYLTSVIFILQNTLIVSASSNFYKYPLNPIFSEQTNNWDSQQVRTPLLIKNQGIYQMWYDGNSGSGWKIGYAFSINGTNNWTRNNLPVVIPFSNDNFEKEISDGLVRYNNILNQYQMWFTSIDTSHWTNGLDRFRTRYALSIDGQNWVKNAGWVLYGTINTWDSGGTFKGRSIIYNTGKYHMWYSGTNNESLETNPFWRIGYATSNDGVNWVKQNNGNPVITPTTPWELKNVFFPSVIFKNNVYHMWYATTSWDEPTQIVYAYSFDGINWIKPKELNPVLTRGTTWDSVYLGTPNVIHDGDVLKMWYSGYGTDNRWRIGYATASADWLPTITPSPTPSPTLTPTPIPTPIPSPTPTNTPTPTPTPIPVTKVVAIPGMGASWNADALLNCKTNNYKGGWTLAPYAKDIYQLFHDTLVEKGYRVLPFYYDWRKQVSQHAAEVQAFISKNTVLNEKVNLVGHSMGGLVGRAYLEAANTRSKLDKLMTVGSPHQGSILSYPSWSGGQIWTDDLIQKIGLTVILKRCGIVTTTKDLIHANIPSVQNLLPTFSYLRSNTNHVLKPISQMVAQNNWLPTVFNPPFWRVKVGTLAGTDFDTLKELVVTTPSWLEILQGLWLDGKPKDKVYTKEGDGTVLVSSAAVVRADNRIISQTHAGLISSKDGVYQILDFLKGDKKFTPLSDTTPEIPPAKSALLIMATTANFWVKTPEGKTVNDQEGIIAVLNPKNGNYSLNYFPKAVNTRISVAQFLSNGTILWQDYTHKSILPKYSTLQFDANNPIEQILK